VSLFCVFWPSCSKFIIFLLFDKLLVFKCFFFLLVNQNNVSPNLMFPPASLSQNQYNALEYYQNTSINQQFIPPPPRHQTTNNNTNNNGLIQHNPFYNPTNFASPPVIYFMSPPVSPISNMFVQNSLLQQQQQQILPQQQLNQKQHQPHLHSNHISPCVLIIKNATLNCSVEDTLQFLTGYGEVKDNKLIRSFFFVLLKSSHFSKIKPEFVQIQNNPEIGTSDIFVTFFNRSEAERAVIKKNHQKFGNHIVELFLTI
jgi:hypothetical protein